MVKRYVSTIKSEAEGKIGGIYWRKDSGYGRGRVWERGWRSGETLTPKEEGALDVDQLMSQFFYIIMNKLWRTYRKKRYNKVLNMSKLTHPLI